MTLRKREKKPAENKTTAKKLRTTQPRTRKPSGDPPLVIHLHPAKDYSWLKEQVNRRFQHKRRTALPRQLQPTLATAVDEPFNSADWQFEIKWDGYRALAFVDGGKADLRSRNRQSFNRRFAPIREALGQWPVRAVVDGEVVILSPEGKPDFSALQAWEKDPQGELLYYVFDLLWFEGVDLQKEPLHVRRDLLRKLVPDRGPIRFSESIEECGTDFFRAARDNGLEGIIAKRKDAPYKAGQRTKDWLKIKADKRLEALICGYTKKAGTDRLFSSLVLGTPEGSHLRHLGQVGSGFSADLQVHLLQKLRPLTTNTCPFPEPPAVGDFVQWVRPHLLCEVRYTEQTTGGLLRHPSFVGLREDKFPADLNTDEGPENPPPVTAADAVIPLSQDTAVVHLQGQELRLTHLRKRYWPKERLTKGDLLNYYHQVAPTLVPYLLGRPQSLNRFPNGINGESFYQKNMKGKVPDWLTTFERLSVSTGEAKDFLVCTGEASLLYMVNLGCIELNPWHSRTTDPHHPDWCVIDLDPGRIPFEKVIETARVIRDLLDSLGVPSFPKTSGATGLHIYLPLGARYSYEQSRQLAQLIATLVHAQLPASTSLERNPRRRTDKVYLDYLQNRPIQTICAPYAVRPQPGATVSMPLDWSEVKKGLKPTRFTLRNSADRLRREGDRFQGVLGGGIDLNAVLKTLAGLL